MRKHVTFLFFLGIILFCIHGAAGAVPPPVKVIQNPVTPLPTTAVERDGVVVTTVTMAAPAVGDLAISSVPAGATVILDGQPAGTTTYFGRSMREGSHSVTLKLAGYQDVTDMVVITRASLTQKSYTLVPATTVPVAGKGLLSINSTPSGAVILVDRSNVGTTPLSRLPLAAGSHPIAVQKPGYSDVTDTVIITTDTVTVKSYSMIPVPQTVNKTTITPVKPAIIQTTNRIPLADQLKALGPVTIQPVVIRVGNHTKSPILTTISPYFHYQFNTENVTGPTGYKTPTVQTFPVSYIEVDTYNTYLPTSRLMTSAEVAPTPVWGDYDTVFIKKSDKVFNNANFRWISVDPTATAFYQVSRYPFSDNATNWQNEYVKGLITSGPAKDVYKDDEGFHYFTLNFAPIANHNPSDPPFYTGIVNLDPTVPGQGRPMDLAKIPFTASGIWVKKARFGPVTIPLPAGIAQIPAGEATEQDLGNPNRNMILSEEMSPVAFSTTPIATMLSEMDQTYFVRIVPIGQNGTAGIPSMPVAVTVKRPQPCPDTGSGTVQEDIVVKPPSAEVRSFYTTVFVPDWIHTYDNGALASRAHFVTVAAPPQCSAKATGNQMTDSLNAKLCSMYGGTEPGYHFYADPEEEHWYDTVWEIIKGLFEAFTTVANAVSAAWNEINNLAVQIAAYAVQGLTFGAFDCNSSPACTGLLHAGLALAESSLGIPPTLPNAADLQNMGADYMAKMAADQIGAGGALDAAESAYGAMPDSAKNTIKSNAEEIGNDLANSVASQSSATVAGAAGNFYVPDPLYYQAHPATVMVRVTNPNNAATDQVTLTVSDTGGFYRPASAIVPALQPGDSTVIPIILNEDFSKGFEPGCTATQYVTTNGIPCYWQNWWWAAIKYGPDSFVISFSAKKDGQWIYGLTPSSSGKVLSSQNIFAFDEAGQSCPGYISKRVIKYPDEWDIQQKSLSQSIDSGFSFTEGQRGRLIG